MPDILSARHVLKIVVTVVDLDPILVIHLMSWRRSWAEKRFGHKLMNGAEAAPTISIYLDLQVPLANQHGF